MKRLVLNIKDNKAVRFVEALIDIIPSIEIERPKSKLLEELKEAVKEMKEIKAGKRTAKDIKDLFKDDAV